jgi:hypothetical protein
MTSSEAHERVLEPLSGLPSALEVALAYVEQVQRRVPNYDYHLSRAIEEIQLALNGIRETQTRAVEWWENNGH